VALSTDGGCHRLQGFTTVYEMVMHALEAGVGLAALIERAGLAEEIDLRLALDERRVLAPIDHPDPAHLLLSGTGLTHLGSADTRNQMHAKAAAAAETLTDSMRMFNLGLAGGKPGDGEAGVQPEWFYKGDGQGVCPPEHPLVSPDFALDGGEEPEIVGVYVICPQGKPFRIGFALANEFSDHVTERQNYLYLAHSKLRPASFGPELMIGDLPADVRGSSRVWRGNEVVWEKPFLSGEDNMSHSLANLEHHHFKYSLFRRPGDVHAHFFGAATLSFADGFKAEPGDVFEVEAEGFGLPLRNPLKIAEPTPFKVMAL
jgi:hypothetical protein